MPFQSLYAQPGRPDADHRHSIGRLDAGHQANTRRTWYSQNVRSCRVYFRDRQSVEHGVYVQAVNRYNHAFGLAMHGLRRCSWCHPDYHDVERMTIELLDRKGTRRIEVTREQFEGWLGVPPPALGDKLREHLMMLLGRIEPSRDFRRSITSR